MGPSVVPSLGLVTTHQKSGHHAPDLGWGDQDQHAKSESAGEIQWWDTFGPNHGVGSLSPTRPTGLRRNEKKNIHVIQKNIPTVK